MNASSASRKRPVILTVLVFLTVPSLLAISFLFAHIFRSTEQNLHDQHGQRLAFLAARYRGTIDAHMDEMVKIVQFVAHVHSLEHLRSQKNLFDLFNTIDRDFDHVFEDMGVLDGNGRHLAYVGPHDIMDRDYSAEPWFRDVMEKGVTISDVFLGYRRSPHFIIAVRQEHAGQAWVLRATVNAFLFSSLLDDVRFDNTGEIYIINAGGVLQTRSASNGAMLQAVDSALASAVTAGQKGAVTQERGGGVLFEAANLNSNPGWWLVVQQSQSELTGELGLRAKGLLLLCIFGVAVVLAASGWTIHRLLRHFAQLDMDKKMLNDYAIQSQKLAAIGQLAAGIAHEINNPLAIIGEGTGWLQDLLKRESMAGFAEHDEFKESLAVIATQVGRCREITHKLLSFARKMDFVIREVNIASVVSEVVGMREREAMLNNITIVKNFAPDLPIIHSEPSLLRQALLNLLNNAMDAVHGTGTITLDAEKARGNGVIIRITDSGIGIPKDNLDRVFEPFFTTKEPGQGSGLGLSICHGIIQKLGGDITAESTPGKGSTFTIQLPQNAPADIE